MDGLGVPVKNGLGVQDVQLRTDIGLFLLLEPPTFCDSPASLRLTLTPVPLTIDQNLNDKFSLETTYSASGLP